MNTFKTLKVVSTVVALLIFIKGFLPLKQQISGHASVRCCTRSKFSKVVLVVVDALRTDFIVNGRGANWPYLDSLITGGRAKVYDAKVHPPTVTLPRIKALISGDIPGFVDVIMNFDSAELKADNLLYQMKASGLSSVFYGDDTWLKLFPDTFLRSEGTTSFFVSDYTEVDLNVTRYLPTELSRDDWSMMILHYLGLDHIGHLIGPSSTLIPPKLREMDGIVQQIHSAFTQQGVEDYFIILCGDHGMADQGGHGGVTINEVSTPMVFITDSTLSASDQVEDIHQIDLVPTLSALLNLPTPQNNLGITVTSLLASLLDPEEVLSALNHNTKQLMRLAGYDSFNQSDGNILTRYRMITSQHNTYLKSGRHLERYKKLQSDYRQLMLELREGLTAQLIDYDVKAMIFGFTMLITVILCHACQPPRCNALFVGFLLAVAAVGISVYYVHCTSLDSSKILCDGGLGFLATLLLITAGTSVFTFLYYLHGTTIKRFYMTASPFQSFLYVCAVSHSLTLLASSFIEEEHQVAYFLSATILTVSLVRSLVASTSPLYIILAMLCTTLTRKWNQTGDKWAHLSDIADMLNTPGYTNIRLILSLLSLPVSVFLALPFQNTLFTRGIAVISTLATMLFVMQDAGYSSLSAHGVYEANLVYICCIITISLAAHAWYKQRYLYSFNLIRTFWVLLNSLLHRTVNLPLLALISVVEYSLSLTDIKTDVLVHLYYWMAQSAFFYQGNSHSLSSIDISAGYKGMLSYNPAITACLTLCNTYSGPVYWIISLCIRIGNSQKYWKMISDALWLYLLFKLLDMAMLQLLIILERYHLFVWTVFAPKLLYEAASLSIFLLFYLLGGSNSFC